MQITPFVIKENPGGRPLQVAVKRYRFQNDASCVQSGIILILVHGASLNKETWEPFLEDLENLQHSTGSRLNVKEAWAFDCPSHGESSILNDKQLFADRKDVTLEEYARSGLRLLESGLIENLDQNRVIIVGHSVGAMAAVWLTWMYHHESHKRADSCVMIEPPAEIFRDVPATKQASEVFIEPTKTRRDIWSSKKEALQWLGSRRPWKVWDRRALEAYVEYGLRPLPTSLYPDQSGVTLSCDRVHECFIYTDLPELNIVREVIPLVRRVVPLHLLLSERSFISPKEEECKKITSTPGISTTRIPKGDHLIVEETPKVLAQLFWKTIQEIEPQERSRARL